MAQAFDNSAQRCDRAMPGERLQLGVIVVVLTMAVSWIYAYASVINAPAGIPSLSPALASELRRQHAAEMNFIEAQTAEVYGSAPRPAPAGS